MIEKQDLTANLDDESYCSYYASPCYAFHTNQNHYVLGLVNDGTSILLNFMTFANVVFENLNAANLCWGTYKKPEPWVRTLRKTKQQAEANQFHMLRMVD